MQKSATIFQSHNVKEGRPRQHSPPHQEEKGKLQELLAMSQTPLLEVSTVFPFDLFPDTIVVDATKIHIINREFFFSEEIHSIPIKNIVDIYVDTGPFLATLRILPQLIFQNQVTEVPKLWKSDALKARDVIQGLIVATKEHIDVAKLPEEEDPEELEDDLEQLGRSQISY